MAERAGARRAPPPEAVTSPAAAAAAPAATPRPRRVWATAWTFVRGWLPVVAVAFAYDAIHDLIGTVFPAHVWPQIRLEQALFGAPVPSIRLQAAFYDAAHPGWWDFAALAVYMSHFFLALGIAAALWGWWRPRYHRFVAAFVGMTTLGYATYILYPAAPPWLASQHGALPPLHRIVRELWDHLGRHDIAGTFSGSNLHANDIAAIPSLHAAYPVLIAAFFWRDAGRVGRAVLALYALAMAAALVYAGEHYVVDIALGWIYALATAAVIARLWPADGGRLRTPGR